MKYSLPSLYSALQLGASVCVFFVGGRGVMEFKGGRIAPKHCIWSTECMGRWDCRVRVTLSYNDVNVKLEVGLTNFIMIHYCISMWYLSDIQNLNDLNSNCKVY